MAALRFVTLLRVMCHRVWCSEMVDANSAVVM
jgi:hypothetical protein